MSNLLREIGWRITYVVLFPVLMLLAFASTVWMRLLGAETWISMNNEVE